MTNMMMIEEAAGARSRVAVGNRSPISAPSDLFATRDGWVLVQVVGQDMFERWCKLVGGEELLADPRYADDICRGENGQALSAIMAGWCASRSTQEVLDTLRGVRIPGCPLLSPAQALAQAQDQQSGFVDWQTRAGLEARVPVVTTPVRLSGLAHEAARAAPALGEHNDAILQSLGYGVAEVAALRSEGVV